MKFEIRKNGIIFFVLFFLLVASYQLLVTNTLAAVVCQTNSRTDGFLTSYDFNAASRFGNPFSKCIVDPRTYISTQKLKYADLREQYFTKARTNAQVDKITVTTDLNETNLSAYLSGTKDVVVYTTGTVRISSPISGTKTGVFFIDGDLEIQSDVTYGTASTGLVFVVNGDIKINRLTSTINAVLMADGIIYSTWDYIDASRNTQPRIGAPQPLIVNGSIISLDSNVTQKIRFNRTLTDNSVSAERVLYQPKYLIILKGLMTDTITFQKEVTVTNFATPFPTAPPPGPGGTPTPSTSPSPTPSTSCPSGNPLSIPYSVTLPIVSVSSTCTLNVYP